jgi:hypothetical protein
MLIRRARVGGYHADGRSPPAAQYQSSPRDVAPCPSSSLVTDDQASTSWGAVAFADDEVGQASAPRLRSPTRRGPPTPCCLACARSAAVCDAIVSSFFSPNRRHPGIDRRTGHGTVVLPGRPVRYGPAVVAPKWHRPPTHLWPRDDRRRIRSRPPGRSPTGMLSVAPRQELGQRLGHHGGDRAPRLLRPLPDPSHQHRRQPDGEHHRRHRDIHPPTRGGTLNISMGLAHRAAEPLRQTMRP